MVYIRILATDTFRYGALKWIDWWYHCAAPDTIIKPPPFIIKNLFVSGTGKLTCTYTEEIWAIDFTFMSYPSFLQNYSNWGLFLYCLGV